MPCQVSVAAIDDVPTLSVSHDEGLKFFGAVSLDFECQMNKNDANYYQLFTINSQPIHMTTKIEIQDEMTLILNIEEFDLKIKNVTDYPTIGPVNVWLVSEMIDILEPAIKGIVNLAFKNGIDMTKVLHWLGINFIEFKETLLKPMDGYFIFYLTPGFDLKFVDKYMEDIGNFLFEELVMGEDLK